MAKKSKKKESIKRGPKMQNMKRQRSLEIERGEAEMREDKRQGVTERVREILQQTEKGRRMKTEEIEKAGTDRRN